MSKYSFRFGARGASWLAVCLLVLQPQYLLANSAEQARPISVVDVELQSGGSLQGQIVGGQGQCLGSQSVCVVNGQRELQVFTDAAGKFSLTGLTGATYSVQVGDHVQLIRAWAPGTAPPGAISELMIVPDDTVVLGQDCGAPVCGSGVCCKPNCLRNPLVLGAIIAAAVAIPIALENSDDDPASP